MVTHRLRTALEADEIYLLEQGTISHLGTPSEALTEENFIQKSYQDLISIQLAKN